jgi:hypothetical protein
MIRRHGLVLTCLWIVGCTATQGRLTRETLRPLDAADRQQYAHDLRIRARQLGLFHSRQWLRLGHWRENLSGGYGSQADGENFFLSPQGKNHPELELDATIDAFFRELQPFDPKLEENRPVQHPICQFPARFAYLSEQLQIDASRLPAHDCSRYDEYLKSLQAESATLVFSAYYLNNPASAFGHTFLRIHKKNAAISEDQRQLLDYAIEFSATPDTTFAPIYAVKGLLGAFPGTFRKLPYYYKVRQYNDFESRDLWEYKLRLTPKQMDMLLAHLWELGSTFFDYFYLSENCSYHLLGLLEAADPDIDLLDKVHWPTIPADAVKAVNAVPGFVERVDYRASARTRFRHQIHGFSGDEQEAVEKLSVNPKAPLQLSGERQIAVIDAAQDLVDIQHAKELIAPDHKGSAAILKQELLERRASLLVRSPDIVFPTPWSKQPQKGHDSRRISLGGGADDKDARFVELSARLALHDLADSPDGFPELLQLEFLPTRARYDFVAEKFRLESLDLVHILSLTPLDPFDHHISWEFRLGSERLIDEGCNCYAARGQFGGGGTLSTSGQRLTLWTFFDTQAFAGRGMDGVFGAPIRIGIGGSGGMRLRIAQHLVSVINGAWDWLPGQKGFDTWYVTGTLRWTLLRNFAIDANVRDENETLIGVLSTMLYL